MDLTQIIIMIMWSGLNVLQGIESYDEIFMVGNKRCIINGSAALAISKPISNTNAVDDNKVSSYYPPSESKCTFEISGCSEENLWVPTYWKIVNSIDGPVQHYVTDRRWEGFTMNKLKSNQYHQQVLSFNNAKNFVIPLSVRSNRNGFVQISLCHGVSQKEICYCIKLAQTESSIWRCTTNLYTITSNSNNRCVEWNNGQRVNFEDISKDTWSHLVIVGRDNMVKVLRGNNVIMSFNDSEPAAYDERILYVYSQNPSLWKVHEYNYISTKTPNTNGQIGPKMYITNSTTCISILVAMCQTCRLQFKISIKKDNDESETIEKIVNSKNEMWTEETLIFNTQDYIGKTFTIWQYSYPCEASSNQELFWAIDDIRTCAEKEYRYIESKEEKFTCQKLGIQQTEILKIDDKTTSPTGINCPEDTFGKYCIPCSIFGEAYCGGFLYCDQNHSDRTCHCTSGYLGECKTGCRSGYYGHGCENICSEHCSAECSNVNGVCAESCKVPYTGPKCEKPKVFLFVNSPNVTDVTSTSGIVQVHDFAVDAPEGAGSPNYYSIEYGEDSNQNVNRTGRNDEPITWNKLRYNLSFNKDPQVKIEAIKPDTFYRVRATINETKENYIKSTRFLTKCTDITTEDVTITPSNDSATIHIKWPMDHCRFSRYKLFCNNTELNEKLSNPIVWARIEPYTLYKCTIKKENISVIGKEFRTDEGVPSVVQDVSIMANGNKISISWKKPNKEKGEILGYNIVYFYLGSKESSCGPSVSTSNHKNVPTFQTSITLEDLKFYSKYKIKISAVTSKGEGEQYESENIETNQLDDISDLEMPGMEAHNASSDDVTIYVTKIACEDFTGLIFLQGNASCSHKWCTEKNTPNVSQYSTNSPSITITGLSPYSNYTAYLAMSRDKKSWRYIGQVTFQTKPAVPNSISNLEVISKNATSISLRWLKPYPPTGILELYIIRYSYRYSRSYIWTDATPIYVSPQSCGLWKEYHCGNLTKQIYNGYSYNIKISAKNKNVTNDGTASSIYVTIKDEASLPTYGISLLWDEDNDLNITWYHPNNTNGELRSFEIQLKVGGKLFLKKSVRVTEANYSLTYTKTVSTAELLACTEYTAAIRVHNVNRASAFNHSSATSPPDIPQNISIENLETETTNTTITIHVSSVEMNTALYQKRIYILVSKAAETDDLVPFEQNLLKPMDTKPQLAFSRAIYNTSRTNSSLYFIIGDNDQSDSSLNNPPLEPGTNYSISIFMSNQCSGMIRLGRAQKYFRTLGEMTEIDTNTVPEGTNKSLWVLILLLLVPIIGFAYWYKKHNHPKGSDLLIPHERTNRESIALSRMPNPAAKVLSAKPKKSLPQVLPPLNTTHSKPIRISDFEGYVKGVVTSGELDRQHNLFPRGLVKPCEYGSVTENKTKNRYKNLIAYDDTRVKLQKIRGDEYSDYINANYIDGYKKPKCYIATQGPKTNTLEDFWRMIWQEKVRNIVMLANVYENGKKKVEKYWPDINENLTFGNVRVQHVSADIFANFDIRVFTVHCNNEERKINQLHFTTWPDHGVPLYSQSLVPFLQRVLKIPYNPQSPIVVHCSAGVGRTGTIILSDICLRMAAGEGSIDFLAYLENIRSQRANLVDNIEQYKLAHLVVLECLFGLHTAVPCNKEMKKIIDGILAENGIQKQMKYIVETQWQDSAMETMLEHEEVFPNYPEKNRFKEIIPRHYRVFLTKYPVDDDSSFYINAVQVDGFRNPGRFISTQQPMPNTLGDFWRMVVERSCTTIISLNMLHLKDKTVCKFWPENGEELNPLDTIRIQHIKTKRLECYKVITLQVKFVREEAFTVDILEMDNWNSDELLPNSIEEFLAFLDASEAISRNSEHVIVTCYDGVTASGLYLAMTFLIEKMKLEQECDVCLAVRTIRHSRKEFVTKREQYEFLYRASVTFIAGFQSYANFT